MAGCDYYSCDVCGRKTFYDAELSYYGDAENPVTHHPWPNGAGAMIVLCTECAKTHTITVMPNVYGEPSTHRKGE